jgi:hypothetical protein
MCKRRKIFYIKINISVPFSFWYKINFGLHPFASVIIFQLWEKNYPGNGCECAECQKCLNTAQEPTMTTYLLII